MLYHLGPNPTVDLIVSKIKGNERFILLIKRSVNANAEPNKWAFPGGFINSLASKGEVWQAGSEKEIEAAKRELKEETGLDLSDMKDAEFHLLGIYDHADRDPRNTNTSWIASHVFAVNVSDNIGDNVKGNDDADNAKWFSIDELQNMDPAIFAFDHYQIMLKHNYIQTKHSLN